MKGGESPALTGVNMENLFQRRLDLQEKIEELEEAARQEKDEQKKVELWEEIDELVWELHDIDEEIEFMKGKTVPPKPWW